MSIQSAQANVACSVLLEPVVMGQEYRKLLKDKHSTPEEIQKRVEYMQSLCRTIIRRELQNYAETQVNN